MDQPGPPSQDLFAPFWSIMRAMKQTDPQFKLRLDEDLKAALTAAAKQNQRTLSAEIVARLQASFEASGGDIDRLHQSQTILEVAKLSLVLFEMMRDAKGATFPDTVMHSVERIHDMLEAITGKKDD